MHATTLLTVLFVTTVLLANLTGGKVFAWGSLAFSTGILIFPLGFVLTDALNERMGGLWVKQLSVYTALAQVLTWAVLQVCMLLPASPQSPVSHVAFQQVFGSSLMVIVASVVAFLTSQWLDVWVFDWFKARSDRRHLWLRATGSTLVSQSLDTAVFVGIAFGGQLPWLVLWQLWLGNYVVKVLLACFFTPLCYGFYRLAGKDDMPTIATTGRTVLQQEGVAGR
jgi:queuosine precursor transporter